MRREIIDQRATISCAALWIAKRIEFEHHAVTDPEFLEDARTQRDNLDIGLRLRYAEQFDPDLVELAKPPLLRPLVAEHRARIEEFERGRLGEAVGKHRAHHP